MTRCNFWEKFPRNVSLIPHVKCIKLNRRDGLLVRTTSEIESLIKHIGALIRSVKSNMSQTVCKGYDLSGLRDRSSSLQ